MSIAIADCPRCGSKAVTFDVGPSIHVASDYSWQKIFEHFAICRHCHRSCILIGYQREANIKTTSEVLGKAESINDYVQIREYLSLKDEVAEQPPEYLPPDIAAAFKEGTSCFAIKCFNAAAAMFRLCLDMATRRLVPEGEHDGLNSKVRRDLGLRLPWLFKNKIIQPDLEDLSQCIREDGNDGVHAGNLDASDAEDILDFTRALLTRIYTEPERLKIAAKRRDVRRKRE